MNTKMNKTVTTTNTTITEKENAMNTINATKNLSVITLEGNSNCLRKIKREDDVMVGSNNLIVKGDVFDGITFELMLKDRGVTIRKVWFEDDTAELEVIVDKDYYTLIAYNGMPDPVEYLLEDEYGFIFPMSRPATYDRHRLQEFAKVIGTDTIIVPIYDEQPIWLFKIGDFRVYGKRDFPETWYIAPKEWQYTEEDNPWEKLNTEDVVKLYPFCIQENAWPVVYPMDEDLRHDRDGMHHIGIDIGVWGVYEDEKGNFTLMN